MRILRAILWGILAVMLLVILGGLVVFNDVTRGPLPLHDGTLSVAGLNDSVEILRDEYGVPHIYASNSYDLFFAQGYTQAQDRWWQMEFSRATGSGRIQELTGANRSAMGNDVFIRTAGWRRAAERDLAQAYDSASIDALQAFADGVNTYIMNRPADDLAVEYSLLGLTGVDIDIEPWTPADTIVWTKVMAWSLSGGLADATRSALLDEVGPEMLADFEPAYPYEVRQTIVRAEDLPLNAESLSAQAPSDIVNQMITDEAGLVPTVDRVNCVGTTPALSAEQVLQGCPAFESDVLMAGNIGPESSLYGTDPDIGSNNWVISGDLTASGKPILANDPHLAIQMPSIWYEIGLHCRPVSVDCPYDLRGFTFPSAPALITGHNQHIAWGVTNVGPDVIDLYEIEVNPDNPLQYRFEDEWRDMIVHEETIQFGDSDEPVTVQVRETHLGPIINDNRLNDEGQPMGFNNENPRAMRWTALDLDQTFTAFFKINTATNWAEFREALSYYGAPSQNFVYADVEGNIGYQTPGKIPIRPATNEGRLLQDGTTGTTEWLGFIPYDELPRVLNPERGYIHSANEAVVPLAYREHLADSLASEFNADALFALDDQWDYGYRGARIVDLLESGEPFTVESVQAIQIDNMNLSVPDILPYLEALDFDDPALEDARDWLLTWDGDSHADSPHAALYGHFWLRLMKNLYVDQTRDLVGVSGSSQQMWATTLLLDDPENVWWDHVETGDRLETRDDILAASFAEGHALTVEALGEDRSDWRWGDLHQATFISNPLGQSDISLIEDIVNRSGIPTSGGASIVNATSWNIPDDHLGVTGLPSYRMVIDLGDLSQSVSIHTTGQSGHPYAQHYADMIPLWSSLEYKAMIPSLAEAEDAVNSRLILEPDDS